jgi:hypothetical protein
VAGLRECYIQHYGNTPKPVWNPDIPQPINFFEGWAKLPDQENYDNAFKVQWELFLKHVVKGDPFPVGRKLRVADPDQLAEVLKPESVGFVGRFLRVIVLCGARRSK